MAISGDLTAVPRLLWILHRFYACLKRKGMAKLAAFAFFLQKPAQLEHFPFLILNSTLEASIVCCRRCGAGVSRQKLAFCTVPVLNRNVYMKRDEGSAANGTSGV